MYIQEVFQKIIKEHDVMYWKPFHRSDYNGTSLVRFEYYPYTYRAAQYEDGEWLRPQFKCDGMSNTWSITYLAPFFGKDDVKQGIEFK